jgi:O-antigen/teichoic acid export membrane protein
MISGYILNIGDRFFILYFLSEKDLGNYAVSYQLGMLGNFFFTSFNLAWVPIFFEMLKKKEFSKIRKIKKISYYLIGLFSICMLLFVYTFLKFSPFFESYTIQIELVAIISVAYIFISFYKFESNYFFYSKNTKSLSIVTLGGALITIILNLLLIDKIGIYGCAIATLVAALFMFLMVKAKSDKYEKNFFEN